VAAAFFFKVGAAPFHMWLCDVYEGCLTTVSAFFASVPKLVLFSVLIKLYIFVFSGYQEVSTFFLLFSGFLSVFLAAFGGLYQKRLKRLLAYSAISHTGFILLGTSIASVGSIMSCVIYLVLYVFMSLASFSILLLVGVNNKIPKYLVNWAALASRNSVLAITFSLLLFSAAGVPPLSGFYSKLCILLSLLACDFLLATIFVVLLTSVTCFYYIRLIKLLFFANFGPNNFWVSRRSRTIELLLAFAATFVILFFLRPNFLNVFAVVISVSLLPCVF
jgi:NADH-quinone oxidoreductase subunit N